MLDISKNPIGTDGAAFLARMLDSTLIAVQFLEVLALDHCQIPDQGGRVLVRPSLCTGPAGSLASHHL
jgi:hypothetical protein